MPTVVVQQIVQGPFAEAPFQSHGKTIEVTAWMVNALVDGVPMQNIKLRAFSKKVHWAVTPGNVIHCEPIKVHKGVQECKIITPSDQNGNINTIQQPQCAPPQQAYTQASLPPVTQVYTPPVTQYAPFVPPAQKQALPGQPYTLQELEDILKASFDIATGLTDNDELKGSIMGLFMIQACKERIRVPQAINAKPLAGANNPPMQAVLDKTIKEQIWAAVYAKGLGERVSNCQNAITEPLLMEWWRQANQDQNIFAIRLNRELQLLERGESA